jgi:hypothetical protein
VIVPSGFGSVTVRWDHGNDIRFDHSVDTTRCESFHVTFT